MPARAIGLVVSVGLVIACGAPGAAVTAAPAATPTSILGATTPATNPVSTPLPSPSIATPDPALPPDATLAAEGGDPVTGQLGSFIWGDGGSDSPMLPGSPVAVGASEPLSIRVTPTTGVATWSAVLTQIAPVGSAATPVAIDDGPPPMTLGAPAAGVWRLVVTIRFAGHAGSATYTWRLDVRG
jgi:hypothetical protein